MSVTTPSPAAQRSAHVGAGSLAVRTLQRLYFVGLLVVTPLILHPDVIFRGLLPPEALADLTLGISVQARAYALGALLLLGVLVWFVSHPQLRLTDLPMRLVRLGPVRLLLVAAAVATLASSLFQPDAFFLPWLGSDRRLDGSLPTAGWLLLAVVTAALARTRVLPLSELRNLTIAGGALASLYVVLQGFGIEPLNLFPGPPVTIPHPEGTLGHGARTSAYLAMVLLVAVARPLFGARARPLDGIAAAWLALGVASAGGRAALVGLAVAWLVLGLMLGRSRRGLGLYAALTALLLATAATAVVTTTWGATKFRAFVTAVQGEDDSFNHRLIMWKGGVATLATAPLWGVGPGSLAVQIAEHLSERELAQLMSQFIGFVPEVGEFEIVGEVVAYVSPSGAPALGRWRIDKAHLYPLDTALSFGLPAALLLLAAWIGAIVRLLRSRGALPLGLGLAATAYLVFGLAWFPSVTLDPIAWGLIGLGLGAALAEERAPHGSGPPAAPQ